VRKQGRKCQGCGEIFERDLMHRIMRTENGAVLNPPSSVVGRSVYVCKNETCIKTLIKKKRISRGLKFSGDTSGVEGQLL